MVKGQCNETFHRKDFFKYFVLLLLPSFTVLSPLTRDCWSLSGANDTGEGRYPLTDVDETVEEFHITIKRGVQTGVAHIMAVVV